MSELTDELRIESARYDFEARMKDWDGWRKYIADGGGGSWPRDAFECLIDETGVILNSAADEIERLEKLVETLERHVEVLQAKIDPDTSCACGYDAPGDVCLAHSKALAQS